jgi:hypothetical protein
LEDELEDAKDDGDDKKSHPIERQLGCMRDHINALRQLLTNTLNNASRTHLPSTVNLDQLLSATSNNNNAAAHNTPAATP